MGLFNLENKMIEGINKAIDCVWLSILWLVCSLPIITLGAANTALYYSIHKSIRNDRGYATTSFFSAFKRNFKQCTIIWCVMLLLYVLLGFDYSLMKRLVGLGEIAGYIYNAFFVFIIFVTLWGFYIFTYIARFENSIKTTLLNTLYIMLHNIPWTLLIAVLFAVSCIAVFLFPILIVVVPAMYNILKNNILEKVFQKYMSEEQRIDESIE